MIRILVLLEVEVIQTLSLLCHVLMNNLHHFDINGVRKGQLICHMKRFHIIVPTKYKQINVNVLDGVMLAHKGYTFKFI